jgi:hypothetical protein
MERRKRKGNKSWKSKYLLKIKIAKKHCGQGNRERRKIDERISLIVNKKKDGEGGKRGRENKMWLKLY